jgi:hypothetical protein
MVCSSLTTKPIFSIFADIHGAHDKQFSAD